MVLPVDGVVVPVDDAAVAGGGASVVGVDMKRQQLVRACAGLSLIAGNAAVWKRDHHRV